MARKSIGRLILDHATVDVYSDGSVESDVPEFQKLVQQQLDNYMEYMYSPSSGFFGRQFLHFLQRDYGGRIETPPLPPINEDAVY